MSFQSITSSLLIDLSTVEQQLLNGGQVSTPGGQTATPREGVSSPESVENDTEESSEEDTSSCSKSRRRRRFPIRLSGYLYYR
ncbi:hypothetical protein [Calothrix sp. PCC 7507]|uniref:hypothetical protein n=1 Tax=Calothrix sp. PCC 7507 TaxID=99598 RepID=UPI00029F0212|nr:hypothetical protein [Calothrix sp. PCC 7507]AFY32594.1 hypothetical protein Cal7507_2152 [Calothrix sp. PCC 7507]